MAQSWLTDAYTASRTRKPMLPPALMRGATPSAPSQLGGPLTAGPAPGPVAPPMTTPSVTAPKSIGGAALMPSLQTAASTAPAPTPGITLPMSHVGGGTYAFPQNYGPGQPPHVSPPTGYVAPPANGTPPPPQPTGPAAGGANPSPAPGDPGYIGPGAVVGTGNYPAGFDTPANAYAGMAAQQNAAHNQGLFYSNQPGFAGKAWLSYILADPYNRMVTDASERQAMDATNTSFDAARARGVTDALQSGAGESGVARGQGAGLELARGNALSKNARDFEQYKTTLGDQRLQSLLMPYLSNYVAARNGTPPPPAQANNTGDYLKAAVEIAKLFA